MRERHPAEQATLRAALSTLGNRCGLSWRNVHWQIYGIMEVSLKLYYHGFNTLDLYDEIDEVLDAARNLHYKREAS